MMVEYPVWISSPKKGFEHDSENKNSTFAAKLPDLARALHQSFVACPPAHN
jgi:hypothetical protein